MNGSIDCKRHFKTPSATALKRSEPNRGNCRPGSNPSGGNGMEKRIEQLEHTLPEIRDKLTRVEGKADSIEKHGATKADLAGMESTLIKWLVATAFTLTALASAMTFGIARMLNG